MKTNITLIAQSHESGLRVYLVDSRVLFVINGIIMAECGHDDFVAGAAYFAVLA